MHREPRNPKVPKSDMDRAAKQKSVLFWDAQTAGTVPHGRLCWLGWVGYGVVFFLPSEVFQAFQRSSTLMSLSSPWKVLCLTVGSW